MKASVVVVSAISVRAASRLKEFRRPNVNEPAVDDTDFPIIMSGVGAMTQS